MNKVSIGELLGATETVIPVLEDEVYRRMRGQMKDPPNATDLEHALLCGILVHGQSAIEECEDIGLRADDFYIDKNKTIYRAAVRLIEKKHAISSALLCDELLRMNALEDIGGRFVILNLEQAGVEMSGIANIRQHAQQVLEKSRLRKVIEVCRRATTKAFTGETDSDTILDTLQQNLSAIDLGTNAEIADPKIIAESLYKSLPCMGGKRIVRPTGFADVDKMLAGGPEPGALVVIAGRPSMGKTQFALDVTKMISLKHKEPSLWFSLEMSAEQLYARIISSRSGVDIKGEHPSEEQKRKVNAALGELSDGLVIVDQTPSLTIGQVRSRSRAVARKKKPAAIFIDYIQLVSGDENQKNQNKANEIGDITRGLKALAREMNCPVFAISQLSRGVDARADKRPIMSDLRESGAIEQDADIIAFLYRDEYYLRNATPDDKAGTAELIVAKNRNGPTGTVKLGYEPTLPRFNNLAR